MTKESAYDIRETKEIDFDKLTKTDEFQKLINRKKAFIIPTSIFFLVFYFMLPILAAYTDLLKRNAIGSITWAWLYALLQFVSVWTVGYLYMKKSEGFDNIVNDIFTKFKGDLKR